MLKALNLTKMVEFESPRDPAKGTPDATKFKISAIPTRIYAKLKDRSASFSPDEKDPDGMKADFHGNSLAFETVRWGLKGVENYDPDAPAFKFQKEKVGPYMYDVVHDDFMAALDIQTIRELKSAIDSLCSVDEETEKNSEG